MAQTRPNEHPYVSVIIPAYNEEGNIEELCRHFADMTAKVSYRVEVVLIDDGSNDRTPDILKAMSEKYDFVRVLTHGRNRGLTAALQTGFISAEGDIFVFYPADLQYHPEDIPEMVSKIEEGNDLVTGWKQGKYSKRFVSRIYNGLSRRLFNLNVHDLNSVKAFRREVIENIFLRRDWHRYLVPLAVEQGYRVDEVKVPLYPRHSGDSKFSGIGRIPVGLLDLLAVKSQMSLLRKPLLFFGFIGLLLVLGGVLAGIVALYFRFVLGEGYRPLLYLVILLLVMGGMSFILGLLAEGMAAIREELSGIRESIRQIEVERKMSHKNKPE